MIKIFMLLVVVVISTTAGASQKNYLGLLHTPASGSDCKGMVLSEFPIRYDFFSGPEERCVEISRLNDALKSELAALAGQRVTLAAVPSSGTLYTYSAQATTCSGSCIGCGKHPLEECIVELTQTGCVERCVRIPW